MTWLVVVDVVWLTGALISGFIPRSPLVLGGLCVMCGSRVALVVESLVFADAEHGCGWSGIRGR